EQHPEQSDDLYPFTNGNLPSQCFVYQEIIGTNLLGQDDGFRFPQIQFGAKAVHFVFCSGLPDTKKRGKGGMRLQEFVPDCLGDKDFTIEAREDLNSADLDERRDRRRVADDNHLDDRWRSCRISSAASCSV